MTDISKLIKKGMKLRYGGFLVKMNPAKALRVFEQGIAVNDPICLYEAGVILQDGLAGYFDRSLAFDYIERSASLGHVDAIYTLGWFYMNGGMGNAGYSEEILNQKVIDKDQEKGLSLLKDAAARNNTSAILHIARYYYYESGSRPDCLKDCIDWHNKGIELGEGSCMIDMADMLILGIGFEKDLTKARRLYEKARDSDSSLSAINAAEDRIRNFNDLSNILDDDR
ncbi:tetratricopeptide repeat protein [Cerasicoccus maritimus]|uniref:tetratricopeptide repeat protein n=1 Tax=Cerasicoccus maritimus TaxID=490089 RepID=UPI0028525896|nr:tetratricopeptide repeat protein [Cerasicoccus maritimus]